MRSHHHRERAGADGGGRVYGPGIQAAICYLPGYQHLSAKRLAEVMDALFKLPLLTGTLLSVLERAHVGLAGLENQVKTI